MNTLAEYTKGKCSFTNVTVRSLETEWLKEKKKKKQTKPKQQNMVHGNSKPSIKSKG